MSIVVRKPAFCICKNKDADQLPVTAQLIGAFVFALLIVQSLNYLNPKFQASSHLLWPYRPACLGPCHRPRRSVFSQRGLYQTRDGHAYLHHCYSHMLNKSGFLIWLIKREQNWFLFPFYRKC